MAGGGESEHTEKREGGNTLIFDTTLSSTKRRAALNKSGGPTILRGKESAKVSESADARVNTTPVVQGK